MTSWRKIGNISYKSYRIPKKSIGFNRNPIGIYKDHIEIYDELEKDRRNLEGSIGIL